jgi:biotin carboxyl carrier protein
VQKIDRFFHSPFTIHHSPFTIYHLPFTNHGMKLTAEINNETHQLEVSRTGDNVTAEIDGRAYQISASTVRPGLYVLINDGHVFECRVETNQAHPDTADVHVGTRSHSVAIADPKRLRAGQGAGAHSADGAAQIVAPMPGKVVRILVEKGAQVEAGESLMVVEAMKMQNEMKSPRAGVVIEIRAIDGATVNAGDVLAVME